ncbi:MAG: DUF4878 domain-containing protein [Rikenellaceae bacterium]
MKKFLASLLLSVCVFSVACSSPYSKPSNVVKDAFKAIVDEDIATLAELIEEGDKGSVSKTDMNFVCTMLCGKGNAQIKRYGVLKSYEVESETIDESGSKAKVIMKMHFEDGTNRTTSFDAIKRDSRWYLKV